AEQLGLVRLRAQAVTMADGRDGVYDQTEPVTVEVLGRSYALSALVMGHTVLLGAIVLAGLDLVVDPVRQRLMPNLGTWEHPLFRSGQPHQWLQRRHDHARHQGLAVLAHPGHRVPVGEPHEPALPRI